MPKYVIDTKKEFNAYLEQFKMTRGCYNLTAFLELFGVELEEEYDSLKIYSGIQILCTKDLCRFLKTMVTKGLINPVALNGFLYGSNRIYNYSINAEIDRIIVELLNKRRYMSKLYTVGIPIYNVAVPRKFLLNKPLEKLNSVSQKYLYLWEVYLFIIHSKSHLGLSYDVFKDRLIKGISAEKDFVPFQELPKTTYLPEGEIGDVENYVVKNNKSGKDELISLSYILKKYTCVLNGNRVKITSKRYYNKKG